MNSAGGGIADGAPDAAAINQLLDDPAIEAVQIQAPPLDNLAFGDFIRALLGAQGFRLEFRGQPAREVLDLVATRILGRGAYATQCALLADEIGKLEGLVSALVDGARPQTSIRTYFAPGDLVWHVDRLDARRAYRLVWPIGRRSGMRVTARDNIDPRLFAAFMRREHPLLCNLDTRVAGAGRNVELLWRHRPRQLEAMQRGQFPFLIDPAKVWQVAPGAASIHRVETPGAPGTYHRSCWSNRDCPGFQIVITAAAD